MSTPERASDPTDTREPQTPTAIEEHRHRAADAAEAMADALRENDWAEWRRAFGSFHAEMRAARREGETLDTVPEPVDAEYSDRPEGLFESGAFAGATERVGDDTHPMRGEE